MASQEIRWRPRLGRMGARTAIMPEIQVRLVAALLALAVAAVHAAGAALITLIAGMLLPLRMTLRPRPASG